MKNTLKVGFAFAVIALACSVGMVAQADTDHTNFIQNYEGSKTCGACHQGKVDEVMNSVHFTWRTENDNCAWPGGGEHGMLDRACALVGSNAIVNFFGDFGEHEGSSACGKCHISRFLPFADFSTGEYSQMQKDDVDCLICHAAEYDMEDDGSYEDHPYAGDRLLKSDEMGPYWTRDTSLRAAKSVGGAITASMCYRCHEHGQADPSYKRGTPYEPEHDVHAAAGLNCTECHVVQGHKIARGTHVSDMHAWELQDVEVACTNCHTDPHSNATYNSHTEFIACETCHIPYTSGVERRVWAPVYGMTEGPEANIPIYVEERDVFEPYSNYDEVDYAARPVYRWFNGKTSMLAEPVDDPDAWNFMPATKESEGAKIYPFGQVISGMVMDRKGIGMDPEFNENFTMLAALEGMQDSLIAAGMMRPEGLTEAEKMVMAQFPNMLTFNKEHYFKTGNIAEAASLGLGFQGALFSGQNPYAMSNEDLIAMGSQMWSGSPVGLDLPDNPADPTHIDDMDPTTATGSFISINHGIKKDGALTCANCHSSSSVLNFKALHFSDERAAVLMSFFEPVEVSHWDLF